MGQAAAFPPMVVPGEFSELALIAWNRDPARPIPAAEAFALYEANWRHVDPARMTPAEADLVETLAREFGKANVFPAQSADPAMTDVARPSFRRPEHRIIAEALAEMKAGWLLGCKCFFGGGTAIVLQHGEYRLSRDLDFLCADAEGYRELRTKAVREGLSAFFGRQAEPIRAFRADQYGLRTVFRWQGQPIKFEIVREARIPLEGAIDARLGVPVLGTADQVAEKLLANADRCIDRSTARRDAIDLGYLVGTTGVFPTDAVIKAEAAYGSEIAEKMGWVLRNLAEPMESRATAESLDMEIADVNAATLRLKAAALAAWPGLDLGHQAPDPS